MISQYASIRNQLGDNDWSIAVTNDGNLTQSGSFTFALQSHNRVGLNLLSAYKTINYVAGDKITVTINSSAIATGEDVFKFVLSMRNSSGIFEQIAEYPVKELDQVTYRATPWTIVLNEYAHIATGTGKTIASTIDFPSGDNRIQGQIRVIDGTSYRYDQFADVGDVETTPGYWIEDPRGSVVAIDETTDLYGCDRSTQEATSLVYGVTLNPATNLITQPIKYWWSNRTVHIAEAGQVIGLQVLINGSNNTNGVSNSVLFDSSITVTLLGYVELATGILNTSISGVGVPIIWRPTTNQVVLQSDLEPGYAASYSITLDFSISSLADILAQGAAVGLNLVERKLAAIYNPVGLVTGNAVLPESDRLRFIPNQILPGSALIDGYQIQYFAPAAIINAFAANTPNQKVVISSRTTSIARIGTPGFTEAIRAVVSTEAGYTPIKWLKKSDAREKQVIDGEVIIDPWDTGFEPTNDLVFAIVQVDTPVHFELGNLIDPTAIRSTYPDVIAETPLDGTLDNLYIVFYEYQEELVYLIPYSQLVESDGFFTFNNPSVTAIPKSHIVESTDSDFGLFDAPEVIFYMLNEGTSGITLPIGFYKVGLTYGYNASNTYPTKISHDASLGCLPELTTSLVNSIFDKNKWLAPVADLANLRLIQSEVVDRGTIVFVINQSAFYWYDHLSTELDDDDIYIELTDGNGTGRFIKIEQGSDILDNLAWSGKGELITYNGANAVILPAPTLNQVLMGDPNSDTGLKWDTLSGESGDGGSGNDSDNIVLNALADMATNGAIDLQDVDLNGYSFGQVVILDIIADNADSYQEGDIGVLTARTQPLFVQPDVNADGSPRDFEDPFSRFSTDGFANQLLVGGWGAPISYLPTEASDENKSRVLVDFTYETAEEDFQEGWKAKNVWVDFSLSSLNDTYDPTTTAETQGAYLRYDGSSLSWIPADPDPIPSLTQLTDTLIPNPLDKQAVIWDLTSKKFITGLPDLTSVGGIQYTTEEVIVPGDPQWDNTTVLLSARTPNQDVSGTYFNLVFNHVQVISDSPYPTGAFSYGFDRTSRKNIMIPTDSNSLLGSDIFCLEFWFKATELNSGFRYYLVSRNNNVEEELEVFIQEETPNVFHVYARLYYEIGTNWLSMRSHELGFSGCEINTWYHVAITRNGGNVRLFVNGVLCHEQPITPDGSFKVTYVSQASLFLVVGALNNIGTNDSGVFVGYIEDFRLTKGHARYISDFTPPSEPLPIGLGGTRDEYSYYITFAGLPDVDETVTPLEDYVPAWSELKGKYVPKQIGASGSPISISLNQVSDVDVSASTTGQFLGKINETTWGAVSIGAGVTSFNGESGVVSVTSDDIPQGLTNLYLNDGAIASKLAASNLEALGNVSDSIANQTYLYKNSSGEWIGNTLPFPVASVNNKTGTVVLTTNDISEETNLYYTDARVSSLLATIPISTLSDISYSSPTDNQALLWNTNQFVATTLTTTIITEGDNLFYTDARVDARITAANLITDLTTFDTDDLAEGTNLYYTDARVDIRIAAASISTLTSLFTGSGTTGQAVALTETGLLEFVDFPIGGGGADLASSTTDDLSEGTTNLYYTDARVDTRIASATMATFTGLFTGSGTTGQAVRVSSGGTLEFVDFPTGGAPDLTLATTDDLAEGTNLYYTDARVDARITAANVLTDLTTFDTNDLAEGTNLYYTDARVDARLSTRAIAHLGGVFTGTPTEGQVATVNDTGKLTFTALSVPKQLFKATTGSYTLQEGDHGYIIKASNDATFTLPTNLSVGFQVTVLLITESSTLTLETSGTLMSKGTTLSNQYGAIYLTHEGSGTWIALGDLDIA